MSEVRADLVNRSLILITLAILVGVFRVYIPSLALPLLGLAALLGLIGAGMMWIGLTQKPREELERLPEDVKHLETSVGIFEVLLLILVGVMLLIAAAIFVLALP